MQAECKGSQGPPQHVLQQKGPDEGHTEEHTGHGLEVAGVPSGEPGVLSGQQQRNGGQQQGICKKEPAGHEKERELVEPGGPAEKRMDHPIPSQVWIYTHDNREKPFDTSLKKFQKYAAYFDNILEKERVYTKNKGEFI